ncbi:MAG: ribbon-helix-helix domain-containing protein [Anaerolineaceae bacterium]
MPKTNSASKPVRSFRISPEGVNQLRAMANVMGRSESDVIEVALDRMYREEIRYNRVLRERTQPEDQYQIDKGDEGENEINRNVS